MDGTCMPQSTISLPGWLEQWKMFSGRRREGEREESTLQVLVDDAMVVKGIDNLRLVLHNFEICEDTNPINSIAFWCFDIIHTETTG